MRGNWHDQQVLVTGAGGFIGSHLVERLLAEGAQVRAFVRHNSRHDPGLLRLLPQDHAQQLEVVYGDLRDPDAVAQAVRGCETVFHLGALISIPYSYYHPVEVVETNIMGTLNVLLACREVGVERLVHTSTSEVYGTALSIPMDESHPLQGQSPYSASKIGADKLAESYALAFNMPVVTVRPFNTYGPRQSARAVIPTIITQALALDVIHLGSLDTRRDFTFVSDTVHGFILAAQAEGVEGQTFNLGVGHEIRIGEIAQKIIHMVGRDVQIQVDDQRLRPEKSEVRQLLSDNRKARAQLGWEPQVSLDEGLQQTIAWARAHLDLFATGTYQF
jgi:dTDP-glucose 4,6-dehydratase